MKKIIITGSCGFILGNFIRKVIHDKQPYTFLSIDRINNNAANSMYWSKDHTFYLADIRDQHIIDTIFQFEQPNIVIHGAAENGTDRALTDPNSFMSSNVLGTQSVINACIKHKVEKLIYLSTVGVMGQLTSENDLPWKETDIPDPRNPESASKYSGELLVKAAAQSHGLIYNITRSCNNYGPRQNTDKLIPRVIKSILEDKPIPVYGQGLQIRDWLYVSDHCNAIMEVVKNGKNNEIYNISANQEISNIEIVQKICNIIGRGHNLITYVDDPRKSHDFRYSLDSSKIRKLGWTPEVKLKNGLQKSVEWALSNQWFFK